MADNAIKYGFRWATAANGGKNMPTPLDLPIASGANFTVTAVNYRLSVGDPVIMASTGTVTVSLATNAIYGIVVGFSGGYYDGSVMKPSSYLPSGVTYGSNLERQTRVQVVPAHWGLWEIDCDDAVTATTLAAYQALVGENADHALAVSGVAGTALNPRLDISDHQTTTAQWRIVGVSKTAANQDYSGNYVKMIVFPNESQWPEYTATGV